MEKSMRPVIEKTADGSHTLFVPELDEHYHSVNGAIQESMHVYIDTGLRHCLKDEMHVFEVGFGTGLNAFLTLLDAQEKDKTIHYTSVEAYPLDSLIVEKLNYPQKFLKASYSDFEQLHNAEWNREVQITDNFYLKKLHADFSQFDFSQIHYPQDIIYFDAFAPDKQSDLWNQDIFNHLYSISAEQGILVTYCAKGNVRRMMQQAGYTTERLPGPPGKREMLRATK